MEEKNKKIEEIKEILEELFEQTEEIMAEKIEEAEQRGAEKEREKFKCKQCGHTPDEHNFRHPYTLPN